MSENTPTPNGGNGHGRGPDGKFVKGNSGGPGNPLAKKTGQLRAALIRAVSVSDLRAVIKNLVQQARGGDVAAAKLLIERVLGPAVSLDVLERLEALEQAAEDTR